MSARGRLTKWPSSQLSRKSLVRMFQKRSQSSWKHSNRNIYMKHDLLLLLQFMYGTPTEKCTHKLWAEEKPRVDWKEKKTQRGCCWCNESNFFLKIGGHTMNEKKTARRRISGWAWGEEETKTTQKKYVPICFMKEVCFDFLVIVSLG
jgi:hypothetical protein